MTTALHFRTPVQDSAIACRVVHRDARGSGASRLLDLSHARRLGHVRDAVVLVAVGVIIPDRQHGGHKCSIDFDDEIRAELAHLTADRKKVSERTAALRTIMRSLGVEGLEAA